MTWEHVQALRKSGRFQEAVDLGLQELADDPGDFKLRTQIDWAFYGLVKNHVFSIVSKLKGGQPAPNAVVNQIHQALRRYARQPKRRPDNALSNILRELSKIAPHFPFFPGFIRWVGFDGLAAEDWQYNQLDENRFPPIALGIARGLAKWMKAFPEAAEEEIDLALEWIDRVRPAAEGDDALWMDWDRVYLLRRVHRHAEAAGVLGPVIKAKRNEFWVWAEAARLYAEEQPDLALACACRALECGSDPKFTVKVHRELAQMLADRGEFAQASSELASAITLRQEQGWGIDAELQDLINSSWYDPSAQGAERAGDFYAHHSQDALVLCFDSVEVKPATYLGTIVPQLPKDAQPGRKARPLPRFAIRESNGASVSIVGPGIRCRNIKIGDPVTLVLGRQRDIDRDAIVQVSVRTDGASWDCTDSGMGLVTREAADERRAKVFVDRDLEVGIDDGAWHGSHSPKVGEGVRFRVTANRKTGRRDLFAVEPGPHPDADVKVTTGHLKRNPKGFAFVDDAFVPPFMVETVPPEVDTVVAVLVYAKHPKEDRYGWRAVAISAA
ncbi:MAG: tetratricopeptide repeat protein [Sterolibacteriaceae bacterium]|nr:tetratricopeptide repeat protein [Sterolibacteriaceae bacterium]